MDKDENLETETNSVSNVIEVNFKKVMDQPIFRLGIQFQAVTDWHKLKPPGTD